MKCKECSQAYDPNENPKFRECPGHGAFRVGPAMLRPGVSEPEHVLCGRCGKSFGDVGELIEAKGLAGKRGATIAILVGEKTALSAQVATLTRERDEAQKRAKNLENTVRDYESNFKCALDKVRDSARIRDEAIADKEKVVKDLDAARDRIAESEHNLLSLNEYYLGRIAELEDRVFNGRQIVAHANGTWEWRKV